MVTWEKKKNVADLRVSCAKRTSNKLRLAKNLECSKCRSFENRRCIDKIYDQQQQTTVTSWKNIFSRSIVIRLIEQFMRKFFEADRVWKNVEKKGEHERFCCIESNCIVHKSKFYTQCKPQARSSRRFLWIDLISRFNYPPFTCTSCAQSNRVICIRLCSQ